MNRSPKNLPTVAEGLAPTDIQRVGQFLDSSVSDNTRSMYRSDWNNFEKWAHERAALTMPASPKLVAACLSHLVEDRRLSVPTVGPYRATLATSHPSQIAKSRPHQISLI